MRASTTPNFVSLEQAEVHRRRLKYLLAPATATPPQDSRPNWTALTAIFLGGAAEMGMAQWLTACAELDPGMSRWTGAVAPVTFPILWSCWKSAILFINAAAGLWYWIALLSSILVGFTR